MKQTCFTILTLILSINLLGQINPTNSFFDEQWEEKYFQTPGTFKDGQFDASSSNVKVNILTRDSINAILPTLLGVNTTFRSGNNMGQRADDIYIPSGWKTYRYPAGSGSNKYFFDNNSPSSSELHKIKMKNEVPNGESINVTPIDGIDNNDRNLTSENFANFIKYTNGEGTVVVNYYYARYLKAENRDERVLKAAKYAASFVKKLNIDHGANVKYWEIGNEIYGKWEEGYYVDGRDGDGKFIGEVTPSEYGEDLIVFAQEMKKIDPTIKIGAVVIDNNDDDVQWNQNVISKVIDVADFLVVHNYFLPVKEQSLENILSSTHQIKDIKESLEEVVMANGKPRGFIPIAMTEYNIRAKIVNNVMIENHTISMINAIFTAEILAEFVKNSYGMAARWVGEWKTNSSDLSQDQKGTIAVDDPRQKFYSPRQAYMPYRYMQSYFGDYLIDANSDDSSVKVYASRFTNNKIGVLIINQGGNDKKVELNIKGAVNDDIEFGNAYWYEVYANNIELGNTKFYINGETSNTVGGGPENFIDVLPYKAAFNNNDIFTAKKYSINYIVIDVTKETLSVSDNIKDKFSFYPNPVNDILNIESLLKVNTLKVYNNNGMLIHSEIHPSNKLDLSNLNKGIFYVHLNTDRGVMVKKIMKL